jgi:hypothetical protein
MSTAHYRKLKISALNWGPGIRRMASITLGIEPLGVTSDGLKQVLRAKSFGDSDSKVLSSAIRVLLGR